MRDENDFLSDMAGRDSGCLTPAQLESLAAGQGAGEHRRHVEACLFCQTELELLTSFAMAKPAGTNEAAAVDQIVKRLQAAPQWRPAAASGAGRAAGKASSDGSWWSNLFTMPMRGFAVAGLAAVLAVGFWFQQREVEPGLEGFGDVTRSSGQPEGLYPHGDLTAPPAELRWQPVNQATQYDVKLLEVDGTALWQSRVSEALLPVPEAARAFMTPRKTLFWSVTALNAQGKALAPSARQQFRVVPGGQ